MTKSMATETRPDDMRIWPHDEGGFGIDVRWTGGECNLRAAAVQEQLADAGVEAVVTPDVEGRGWELHVGPVPGPDVAHVLDDHGLTPS